MPGYQGGGEGERVGYSRTAKPKTRKTLAVPADPAVALRENKTAAATFEKLPPSPRREYIEWITEAKREETRRKRLATTLEWRAEGKARNWQGAKR